jgi:flagellin
MSLFVQTNVASLNAQTHFASTELKLAKVMGQLSSGYRINSAADDAAGLGMAKRLSAQVASYGAATRNANDAIAMTQTADGGAEQISNVLTRLRELAVQGANGSLGAADGANLDTEFQAASSDIDRIAKVTTFNGINLLSGATAATSFQVGIGATAGVDTISVSFGGGDVAGLTMGAAKVDTAAHATTAIGLIDAAITTLNTLRAGFGAGMNRMQNAVSDLQSMQTNTAAALSAVQDVDVAQATGVLAQTQVLAQAGESVLAQANQMPQLATSLIRGQ